MKKVLATLTALTFVLGGSAVGFSQTAAKQEAKPAVQTQVPAAGTQATQPQGSGSQPQTAPVTQPGASGQEQKTEAQGTDQKNPGKKVTDLKTQTSKKEEKKETAK